MAHRRDLSKQNVEPRRLKDIKAHLKTNLLNSPYFKNQELYCSFINSRDLSIQRILAIPATTLEDYLITLIIEYNSIQKSSSSASPSVLADILQISIEALKTEIQNQLQLHKPYKIRFSLNHRCIEKLITFIANLECGTGYKIKRLFELDNSFLMCQYRKAESFAKTFYGIEEFKDFRVFFDKASEIIKSNDELFPDLIPVLKEINEAIGNQLTKECVNLYEPFKKANPHRLKPYEKMIKKHGPSFLDFIQDYEGSFWGIDEDDLETVNKARWFLFDLLDCKSVDALKIFAGGIGSPWRQNLDLKDSDTELDRIMYDLQKACEIDNLVTYGISSIGGGLPRVT